VSAAEKWPPGYSELDDLVRKFGRDHAQAKLMSGQWSAFKCNLSTGGLKPIPVTAWGLPSGRGWLEGRGGWVELRSGGKFGLTQYTVVVVSAPPLMDNPKDADGPKVRLAKELMDAAFPQGEWRQLGIRAVRKGCEQKAKTRGMPLPSADSFSRAMGRRRK
jgi:hypothetical protein